MTAAPLRITVLGCGTSTGVPRLGPTWGACDPDNPKNRRRRAAALIERFGDAGVTRILIDMGPDLREQLIDARVDSVDAVLVTHPHADHIHGIDDLRGIYQILGRRVDVYMDEPTSERVFEAFRYCFETPANSNYPPILRALELKANTGLTVEGEGGPIEVLPFRQQHGSIHSLGFRVGGFTYSTDVSGFDDRAAEILRGTDVWILDALRYRPHSSHFSVEEALDWVERIGPSRTIFTHLDNSLDYDTLRAELPAGVEPAYDGMVIDVG